MCPNTLTTCDETSKDICIYLHGNRNSVVTQSFFSLYRPSPEVQPHSVIALSLSGHYHNHFRHMPNKAGLCCLLSCCHGWPGSFRGQRWSLAASIGLCEGFEARISPLGCRQHGGCVSFCIAGACSGTCVCLSWRAVCESGVCASHRPQCAAGLTWLHPDLWHGPSNMNLFCFTLVRCVIF